MLTGSGSILVSCTDSSDDDNKAAEDETTDTGDDTCDTAKSLLVNKNAPRVGVKNSAAAASGLDCAGSSENGGQPDNIEGLPDGASPGQSTMYLPLLDIPLPTENLSNMFSVAIAGIP